MLEQQFTPVSPVSTHGCGLRLNSEKTELLVVTAPSINVQPITSVSICDTIINNSACVKDLGAHFDNFLMLEIHVHMICSKACYQIYVINIRKYITEEAAQTLIQVDYSNCLLIGLPNSLLTRLHLTWPVLLT